MQRATFVLDEGTNEWRYEKFCIRKVDDDCWELLFGTVLIRYESIYHLISTLSRHYNLDAVFKLPSNMDDVPSRIG